MSGHTGAPGASVECLYRDPGSTSCFFAALSDHQETRLDLRSDILGLIATFIWFKAALGGTWEENLSSVIGWPR